MEPEYTALNLALEVNIDGDGASPSAFKVPSPPAAAPSIRNPSILCKDRSHVAASDIVMLKLPSDNIRLVKLAEHSVVNLGKYGSFATSQLVGQPYGVTLEILPASVGNDIDKDDDEASSSSEEVADTLENLDTDHDVKGKGKAKEQRQSPKKEKSSKELPKPRYLSKLLRIENEKLEEIEETNATNELIKASGTKTLSQEEILAMKRQGVSGQEIIQRQIDQHESFALKNEYSKAKYKALKRSKYLKYLILLPSTVHNVCQYYFQLEPKKIRDLRPDTLAQMMALGNVRPGARVVVVDDVSGLLTAAVVERLGGEGLILVLHPNDSPPAHPILPLLNFPPSAISKTVLRDMHWGYTEKSWQTGDELTIDPEDGVSIKSERERNRLRKRKAAQDHMAETLMEWSEGEFDSLLIASQYEILSILNRVLPALGGSAQIVVHSPILQVLSQTLQSLIALPTVLNPTIIEPWLRQYQILPGRTHPEMNGIGPGGFLLHATRVFDDGTANSARSAGIGIVGGNRSKRRKR